MNIHTHPAPAAQPTTEFLRSFRPQDFNSCRDVRTGPDSLTFTITNHGIPVDVTIHDDAESVTRGVRRVEVSFCIDPTTATPSLVEELPRRLVLDRDVRIGSGESGPLLIFRTWLRLDEPGVFANIQLWFTVTHFVETANSLGVFRVEAGYEECAALGGPFIPGVMTPTPKPPTFRPRWII